MFLYKYRDGTGVCITSVVAKHLPFVSKADTWQTRLELLL